MFHVNPATGDVSECRAKRGNCPFGSSENHFGSADEARKAFERTMETEVIIRDINRVDMLKTFKEFEESELGEEFKENSHEFSADYSTFTVTVETPFTLYNQRYEPGDRITFDKYLDVVDQDF